MEKLRKWMRNPKTIQEKKAYYSCPKLLVRGKRSPANLPSSWDDIWITKQKCWKWKSKKRKQWE